MQIPLSPVEKPQISQNGIYSFMLYDTQSIALRAETNSVLTYINQKEIFRNSRNFFSRFNCYQNFTKILNTVLRENEFLLSSNELFSIVKQLFLQIQ